MTGQDSGWGSLKKASSWSENLHSGVAHWVGKRRIQRNTGFRIHYFFIYKGKRVEEDKGGFEMTRTDQKKLRRGAVCALSVHANRQSHINYTPLNTRRHNHTSITLTQLCVPSKPLSLYLPKRPLKKSLTARIPLVLTSSEDPLEAACTFCHTRTSPSEPQWATEPMTSRQTNDIRANPSGSAELIFHSNLTGAPAAFLGSALKSLIRIFSSSSNRPSSTTTPFLYSDPSAAVCPIPPPT